MLILAKDKETGLETVWFKCADTKLIEETLKGAHPRWIYRVVEDQVFHRSEGRDAMWVLGEKKAVGVYT